MLQLRPFRRLAGALPCLLLAVGMTPAFAEDFGFEHLAAIRRATEVAVSPDGKLAAYVLEVPRVPGQGEDGPVWKELHLVATDGGATSRGYVVGEVVVSDPSFTPDGQHVTYLAKRQGDDTKSLWAVPVAGGESRRLLTFDSDLDAYDLSPDGDRLVFRAEEPEPEAVTAAKDKGYNQEIYEEDWRHMGLWIADLPAFAPPVPRPTAAPAEPAAPRRLAIDGTASAAHFSADGRLLVTAVQPRNLIDDRYMLRRVHVLDADSGGVKARFDNPGKLGDFALSPDGRHVAMVSAADPNDPSEGRLKVAPAGGGDLRDLLPGLLGDVQTFAWLDASTLVWLADVGCEAVLGTVTLDGERRELVRSGGGVPLLRDELALAGDRLVGLGETPSHPMEVVTLDVTSPEVRRLTDSNPWLADVRLARQEVVTWKASDGLELEGVLIHPLDGAKEAPLLLLVHGGPEANDRNGWVTNYSRPGQVAASRGYAVFYPNYRGSTGRGVEFSKLGQGDAAGKEFQDLVEAVDHLVATGVADRDRVGVAGGSYGGYATAWCSTYYSDRFRAGVMFVGISNKLSKGFTTDIPIEDKMVHTLFDPWHKWQFSLERSPLYHAEKSRTALLIATGTADTRVHPSQSLQLYRALKLIDKTPVRFVRYPDEPHGNRRAASRDDFARRLIRWMDHFVASPEVRTDLPDMDLGHP